MKYFIAIFLVFTSFAILWAKDYNYIGLPKSTIDSLRMLLPKGLSISNNGNVFIWLNSECPICNKYPTTWKILASNFPNINFIGVFTSYEDKRMAKDFIKKYKIPFQWFLDKQNKLGLFLKVNTTPEVIFINPEAKVQYRGATDDWFYALGKNKAAPQQNYLKNALYAYQNNLPVLIFKTEPIGCIFEP